MVTLPKSLLEAVRALEGGSVEEGLRSIILSKVTLRLKNNQSKSKEFARRYGSMRRLRRRILRSPHGWHEEAELFEWEAILTENQKLKKMLSEAGS